MCISLCMLTLGHRTCVRINIRSGLAASEHLRRGGTFPHQSHSSLHVCQRKPSGILGESSGGALKARAAAFTMRGESVDSFWPVLFWLFY